MTQAGGGKIEVICGCMFAGKTTRLIERLRKAEAAGRRVLAVKHADDTRYARDALATHDERRYPCRALENAEQLMTLADDCDVIGVDEAHFFGRPLAEVCARLAAEGRHIIVAGLEFDAWGRPFPPLPELKAHARVVEICTAPCSVCGAPARFSERLVPVTSELMVGGPGDYEPRCAAHFQPRPEPAPDY